MTNKDQINVRIAKSKYCREMKRKKNNKDYDNFDSVITYKHFFESYRNCLKGVRWKDSVQTYSQSVVENIVYAYHMVQNGELPPLRNTKTIVIRERGKPREIFPVVIDDRVIQKVLCDYSLTPIVERTVIADNCASLKNKGVNYARERIYKMLKIAVNEYGDEFYILVFDFKSYFNSIPHKTCDMVLRKLYSDERLVDLIMQVVRSYYIPSIMRIKDESVRNTELKKLMNNEYKGICLGSQVSQLLALLVPNSIDHLIKDKFGVKKYIRYMDDGIIIAKNKDDLCELLNAMKEEADKLGLEFSPKKTFITKASKGFTFLKVRYWVTKDRKIIKKLTRAGIVRMRRKLKKFSNKVDAGLMSEKNVYDSMQSWLEHSKVAKSYHTKKAMLQLYRKLFGEFKTVKGDAYNETLQTDIKQPDCRRRM